MSQEESPQGKPGAGPGTLVGQVVNGLEIVQLLGAGGMGEVYLARHQTLGILRAIKVIHDNYRGDKQAVARFEREAMALARLEHPNIVRIIDCGELPNGWPFLSMEYLQGRNLEDHLRLHGRLPLADALQVLCQLASALAHAHAQGIVHRDVKPANVILQEGDIGRLKLIDFGLARVISKELMNRLTSTQQMVGSPYFMAPEQVGATVELTGAADVYALSGIAYSLLSGQPPFTEGSVIGLVYAHLERTPDRLSARCPQLSVPALLDEIVFAGLAKRPSDRPAIEELLTQLTQLAQGAGGPSAATPPGGLAELVGREASEADPLREALVNQLRAVIGDLAAELAPADAQVADCVADVQRLQDQTTDLEVEITLLESQIGEAPLADRHALRRKRAEVLVESGNLRQRLDHRQAELARLVDGARSSAAARLGALYEELDQLAGRLRALPPSSPGDA
jgi:serine/threonine-protein kinase